jgi:hypothetical protein
MTAEERRAERLVSEFTRATGWMRADHAGRLAEMVTEVIAEEREACAEVAMTCDPTRGYDEVATAIRARSTTSTRG